MILTLLLVDLGVQKGASDPLNPIKFWLLTIGVLWAVADCLTSHKIHQKFKKFRSIRFFGYILGFFVLSMFVAFMRTDEKIVVLIGDTGRNIGFLNYLFLSIFAFYAAVKIELKNIKSLYSLSVILMNLFLLYGIFQHFKIDFIKWNNPYNSIILLTGNPDFASSLMAMLIVISFAGLFTDLPKYLKYLVGISIVFSTLLVYWTQALQGLVGIAVGIGFLFFIIALNKNKNFAYALLGVELTLGIISVLGMLQIGPLTRYFFKSSITDRGYNWRAAVEMVKHNPLFGVGIDRYGANFLQYRDAKYPLVFGYTQNVTNSHNVFLQYFATSGVVVGSVYLMLMGFAVIRAYRAIRMSSKNLRIAFSGVIAGFLVYISQSVVSIDNLSISLWGWTLLGVIVALPVLITEENVRESNEKKNICTIDFFAKRYSRQGIFTVLVLTASLLLIIPMYRNETGIYKFAQIMAPKNSEQELIYSNYQQNLFKQKLLNPSQKSYIAWTGATHGVLSTSTELLRRVVKDDPKNVNALTMIALISENTKNYKQAIFYRYRILMLDPFGAQNLLFLEKDYLSLSDKTNALRIYDQILKLAPNTDIARQASQVLKG